MNDWFPWILLALLFLIVLQLIRRTAGPVSAEREAEILRRKYGDLPMFEDFFRRLEAEERREKGAP